MNLLNKLRDLVSLEPIEYDYSQGSEETYLEEYDGGHPAAEPTEETPSRRRSPASPFGESTSRPATTGLSNVIGMPGVNPGFFEVLVLEPRSFSEMPQVIKALRERRSVVLNVTLMDADEAQRSVDFVAGGTYAIDGHQERLGDGIFLFTPNCVTVTAQSTNQTPNTPEAGRPAPVVSPFGEVPMPNFSVAAQ
ncbi:MAG: cell division protein SepF [Gloeomargaritaceae cyanobacterium C42_A2020_066]|nr:cell division protein SepF [Gloeomargaritaceae cyanobacterium C42_A2020_066]